MDSPQKLGFTLLSTTRSAFLYAVIGIVFLISSLMLAYSSVSLAGFGFGPVFLRYNPFLGLLAFVFVVAGGFFMFRAGQAKPLATTLRKSLVEQVKSVKENQ